MSSKSSAFDAIRSIFLGPLIPTSHGLRNEMHIGSRSGSGTCFVAFRGGAERRNFSHLESRGNKVSEIAHGAVSCSTVCLLSSRCATRGKSPGVGSPQLLMILVLCNGCVQTECAARANWERLVQWIRPRISKSWEEP